LLTLPAFRNRFLFCFFLPKGKKKKESEKKKKETAEESRIEVCHKGLSFN
jgi:hypothetical protein